MAGEGEIDSIKGLTKAEAAAQKKRHRKRKSNARKRRIYKYTGVRHRDSPP